MFKWLAAVEIAKHNNKTSLFLAVLLSTEFTPSLLTTAKWSGRLVVDTLVDSNFWHAPELNHGLQSGSPACH